MLDIKYNSNKNKSGYKINFGLVAKNLYKVK